MTTQVTVHSLNHICNMMLQEMADIHTAAFTSQGGQIWGVSAFTDLLAMQGSMLIGATCEGDLVGFILLRAVADEAEVITLAVLPAFQRKGVASKLLTFAQIHLKEAGINHIYLEVREDNLPAIQAYKAFGFVKTGIRPDYYETETGQRMAALVFAFNADSKDNN